MDSVLHSGEIEYHDDSDCEDFEDKVFGEPPPENRNVKETSDDEVVIVEYVSPIRHPSTKSCPIQESKKKTGKDTGRKPQSIQESTKIAGKDTGIKLQSETKANGQKNIICTQTNPQQYSLSDFYRKNRLFTREEDNAIIQAIIDGKHYGRVTGMKLFTELAMIEGLTQRTPQALNERFRRHIHERINEQAQTGNGTLPFSSDDLKKFPKSAHKKTTPSKPVSSGVYNSAIRPTVESDAAIIRAILNSRDGNPVSEAFWTKLQVSLEDYGIDHPLKTISPGCLARRVRSFIIPKVDLFKSTMPAPAYIKLKEFVETRQNFTQLMAGEVEISEVDQTEDETQSGKPKHKRILPKQTNNDEKKLSSKQPLPLVPFNPHKKARVETKVVSKTEIKSGPPTLNALQSDHQPAASSASTAKFGSTKKLRRILFPSGPSRSNDIQAITLKVHEGESSPGCEIECLPLISSPDASPLVNDVNSPPSIFYSQLPSPKIEAPKTSIPGLRLSKTDFQVPSEVDDQLNKTLKFKNMFATRNQMEMNRASTLQETKFTQTRAVAKVDCEIQAGEAFKKVFDTPTELQDKKRVKSACAFVGSVYDYLEGGDKDKINVAKGLIKQLQLLDQMYQNTVNLA